MYMHLSGLGEFIPETPLFIVVKRDRRWGSIRNIACTNASIREFAETAI